MVDTISLNGNTETPADTPRHDLPELIHIAAAEAGRIPSPGTQRALKAETGKTFDQMSGPEADGADRIQTLIWMKLRRTYPGLRWDECADVDVQIEDGADLSVDPTRLAAFASSPPSADSGD